MTPRIPCDVQSLPIEILTQILEYVIPVQRLACQPIADPEWSLRRPEGRNLPASLFVSKRFYQHAAPIFYSKAMLEIAPVRPPPWIFDVLADDESHSIDLAFPLSRSFAFCRHLARIQNVSIYSGQTDAVNAEGYEATMRWLIDNTAVQHIWLSFRLMTRLRKSRIDLQAAYKTVSMLDSLMLSRTVYVYSDNPQSPWEWQKVCQLTAALTPRTLPRLQMYLHLLGGAQDPIICPRWDCRKSDNEENRSKADVVTACLENFYREEQCHQITHDQVALRDYPPKKPLYQIYFVLTQKHGKPQSTLLH